MMKIIKILLLICVLLPFNECGVVYADNADDAIYAKVLDNCILYRSKQMNDSIDDVLFVIPESYFVLVLEDCEDCSCCMVQYGKYVGYVSYSTIDKVSFTPVVKTLENITFDIKSNAGTQIWSSPSTNSNILTTLSAGTSQINYVASVEGDVPSGGKSNIWYFISYTSSTNATNIYEGYVYSENTTNLSDIIINTEDEEEIVLDEQKEEKIIYISSTLKTIIVTIIAIPIILFLCIILYKLTKNIKKSTNYDKNFIVSNKQSDDVIDGKKSDFRNKFKNMLRVKTDRKKQEIFDLQDDELM